jgi:hypothetical protein
MMMMMMKMTTSKGVFLRVPTARETGCVPVSYVQPEMEAVLDIHIRETNNEPAGSIKCGEILDYLRTG